ncbi:TetR/AcrR family transcriptional regulator [Amycolatopsis sp. MtRt-6]|uniref:TetR/AcrR family transcriptional regulator n=1 Tax=Amycolatopsis sp. MtRt-6 TaxID=2792782 RepID=UPI001A8F3D28|nr:TetR/AcrR family transcriptional regulator [Amycolatopsis sp. MtRt-6]
MRADAEQNRERILEVARTALKASSAASLQSIAKAAGVGQGTLYRHFPSREALLIAVYRHDLDELIAAAPALLAEHAPAEALRQWFERLAAYGRIKHGVAEAVEAATRAGLSGEYYAPVVQAITLLLDAGKAAGSLRADVDAEDVLLLVGFLWRNDFGAEREARTRHLLSVVMDGLRR